jgi:2-isopropylmalate synthase
LELLEEVKRRENDGFQYEGAEASFELLVRRTMPNYRAPFTLLDYMTVVEGRPHSHESQRGSSSQATVKIKVGDNVVHTASDGNGPVNALDNALRKALVQFYPDLGKVRLVDYKVRVVDQGQGTRAAVRVLIESTDGRRTWKTVGASHNVIEASWMALSDSLEFRLANPYKVSSQSLR